VWRGIIGTNVHPATKKNEGEDKKMRIEEEKKDYNG